MVPMLIGVMHCPLVSDSVQPLHSAEIDTTSWKVTRKGNAAASSSAVAPAASASSFAQVEDEDVIC